MSNNSVAPWRGIIPADEEALYKQAGFGAPGGIGERPALFVIDMQYRSLGDGPEPIAQAVKKSITSCGEFGWRAVPHVRRLIERFRAAGLPVIFPCVAPKGRHDAGRFGDKLPGVLDVPRSGYDFVREVAPLPDELTIPKFHPSAFFGTALTTRLIEWKIDTIFVAGCTTSGCVRATVVDGTSLGFRMIVPQECVYDRSQVSHAVNLFDMAHKYADVIETEEAIRLLDGLRRESRS